MNKSVLKSLDFLTVHGSLCFLSLEEQERMDTNVGTAKKHKKI